MAPASEGRRRFLQVLLTFAGALLVPGRARSETTLSDGTLRLLEGSEFVYVSPLGGGGEESTCHGEVWYSWLDGSVALITGATRWKAKSVAKGLDRARIWVGDYGTWKRTLGTSDDFRQGPSFVGRATTSKDPQLLERMLVDYVRVYELASQ